MTSPEAQETRAFIKVLLPTGLFSDENLWNASEDMYNSYVPVSGYKDKFTSLVWSLHCITRAIYNAFSVRYLNVLKTEQ